MRIIEILTGVVLATVRIVDALTVHVDACVCSGVRVRIERALNRDWMIYCEDCRTRAPGTFSTQRRAKKAWNAYTRGLKGQSIPDNPYGDA